MVHDKERSGDPDLDDKVPMEDHQPQTVRGPDGQDVVLSEVVGPTNPDGSHAALDDTATPDHRPAEGDTATKPTEVQRVESADVQLAAPSGKDKDKGKGTRS